MMYNTSGAWLPLPIFYGLEYVMEASTLVVHQVQKNRTVDPWPHCL